MGGDKTYHYLFPNRELKNIKFLFFQQAVINKEILPTISSDDLRKVKEFIEKRYEEDNNVRDHPWKAMKVEETQTDKDLEKGYVSR